MTYIKKTEIKLFKTIRHVALAATIMLAFAAASCSESQSYSDLLREEEVAVNHFLAGQRVCVDVPADSISFETGPEAPFYKLDEEGYVYMQVISKGDPDDRVEAGDVVYFRYNRTNLKALYLDWDVADSGNSENLGNGSSSTSFVYKNTYLPSSTMWGTGIQLPLKYFGYNCEVNLVLQSYYGFMEDQTNCMPYLVNVRYFKPEY